MLQPPSLDNAYAMTQLKCNDTKIDRKHYLLLFYNLDITFLHLFMELPTLLTNFIEFRPNFYNLKTQQQQHD